MKEENFAGVPVYRMAVDTAKEDGVNYVALVDKPAIQRDFLAFANDAKRLRFSVDDGRRIVSGPLMLADTPIYRNQDNEEYYVVFPKETIEMIVQKFFANGYQQNVNLMHDDNQQVEGVIMFESFITDMARGILPMTGFEDVPDGSWFGSFHVTNDQVWSQVKNGNFKGFSVEGLFARMVPVGPAQDGEGEWWNDPEAGFTEDQRNVISALAGLLK